MAAVLASSRCCCHSSELISHDGLSFSGSISVQNLPNSTRPRFSTRRGDQNVRFQVQMRQAESQPKLGVNGRAVKMVPASEVMKKRAPLSQKVEKVNGFASKVDKVNGSAVNGATLVKSSPAPGLVKRPEVRDSKELPPLEELKVLPSDEGFSWANENYNSVQRSIDVWSFVISLRVRVLFDNAKWAYPGGFNEDKQVGVEAELFAL